MTIPNFFLIFVVIFCMEVQQDDAQQAGHHEDKGDENGFIH